MHQLPLITVLTMLRDCFVPELQTIGRHCTAWTIHLATCFFRTADNVFPVAAPFQAVFACRHCVPCVERRMGHGFPHLSAKASSAECLGKVLLSGEFHSRTTSYNSPEWGQCCLLEANSNSSPFIYKTLQCPFDKPCPSLHVRRVAECMQTRDPLSEPRLLNPSFICCASGLDARQVSNQSQTYGGWKKSYTTLHGWNPLDIL